MSVPLLLARGEPQEFLGPFHVEQCVLSVQTEQDGFSNSGKCDVERVSFRVDFVATVYTNSLPQNLHDPQMSDLAPEPRLAVT